MHIDITPNRLSLPRRFISCNRVATHRAPTSQNYNKINKNALLMGYKLLLAQFWILTFLSFVPRQVITVLLENTENLSGYYSYICEILCTTDTLDWRCAWTPKHVITFNHFYFLKLLVVCVYMLVLCVCVCAHGRLCQYFIGEIYLANILVTFKTKRIQVW
jgi:hypothetical protein